MIRKSSFLRIILGIMLITINGSGCKDCKELPSSDTIPPTAFFRISFINSDGESVSREIEINTTVDVPAGNNFTILYSGKDNAGVKTLALRFEYTIFVGDTPQRLVQPLISPKDFSDCAKTFRLNTSNHEWDGKRIWIFQNTVTDFFDNYTSTAELRVRHGF